MQNQRVLFVCAAYYHIIYNNAIILRDAGIEVSIFAPKANLKDFPVQRTREFLAPNGDEPEAYLDALKAHLDEYGPYDLVVLNDEAVLRIARRRSGEAWIKAIMPVDFSRIDESILASKVGFAKAMTQWSLPTPEWVVVETKEELHSAAEKLGFPFMVKPDGSSAGGGISKATGNHDFDKCWETSGSGVPILAQRFIVGKTGSVNGLYIKGRLIAWMSSYKHLVYPEPFGPSAVRLVATHEETEEILKKFGELSGYHGFLGLDWIEEEKTGKLFLIELNARPTPTVKCGWMLGMDYGGVLRKALEGNPPAEVLRWRGRKPPVIPMFPQALKRAMGIGSKWELIKVLTNRYFWRDIQWGEKKLLKQQWSLLKRDLYRPWMRLFTAPLRFFIR